jgi:hypothetical protein
VRLRASTARALDAAAERFDRRLAGELAEGDELRASEARHVRAAALSRLALPRRALARLPLANRLRLDRHRRADAAARHFGLQAARDHVLRIQLQHCVERHRRFVELSPFHIAA